MLNHGVVTYPGIAAWESFTLTDISGITPSVAMITMFPQFGLPAAEGDLVLTYDDQQFGLQTIVFKNCKIDSASYERNSGGQVVSVRILDERWAWKYGSITGHYNMRLANNFVNPAHERSPQELAELCFTAMGVADFDVSALPDDARPEVDWDQTNPAQELAKLCDELGCRIVPQRSTGKWLIVVTGEGEQLPDQFPYEDAGDGFDPKELPDYIKIVTAPVKYQVTLPLEPIGKDVDLSWKPIRSLSYTPNGNRADGFGFGPAFPVMSMVSNIRVLQPDGTRISPRELATQTVFRNWRVDDGTTLNGTPTLVIPGFGTGVSRKQLILSNELVELWVDDLGAEHNRSAFIFGQFFSGIVAGSGNVPPGTRIDFQFLDFVASDPSPTSFSLSLDPNDSDRSMVTTSAPMVLARNILGRATFSEATLFLTCAVQVRDPVTWQPTRTEFLQQIGQGTNTDFCLVLIKDDIQPWFRSIYDIFGDLRFTRHNVDEVQQQCQYYADSIAKTLESIVSSTRTYIGLFPIDLDGTIQQVTYKIGGDGSSTVASYGNEHNLNIPTYEDRRQRDGRQDFGILLKNMADKLNRQAELRGIFNT